jgi:hypothetical protein
MEFDVHRGQVGGNYAAQWSERTCRRIDRESGDVVVELVHDIEKMARRSDGNEPRVIAGGNRGAHRGELSGSCIHGECGNVVGNIVGDVSEMPRRLDGNHPGIRAAGGHGVFRAELAGLRVDSIGRKSIGRHVGDEGEACGRVRCRCARRGRGAIGATADKNQWKSESENVACDISN